MSGDPHPVNLRDDALIKLGMLVCAALRSDMPLGTVSVWAETIKAALVARDAEVGK